ncbi:YifB family Mg chelatase-like AAA ATPase [Parvularcula sp. LCG005]|uniref:YifB family Mg chelatase-like AAA ATPase n=1 Tax=Parvularcula sp. LCG005 TaxID=3078805 RepID=UPI00294270B0|nr:YifB family Mg chelatase-like AAA ATPase [Parvularcula sp. LCG005]WOI53520.1 YifB family Mg chelatase-like AAA ATPase [Parvularcula sp. LCG005]
MVAEVTTFAFEGVEARPVSVQAQITGGNPKFFVVGLPDKSVSEARERIWSAFAAIGLGMPPKRITVNLAPADLRKEGSHFDLPIALALMVEMGAVPRDAVDGFAVMGELGLDGTLAPTNGALPAAISAHSMDMGLICPQAAGAEAAWAGEEVRILAPQSLLQLANHFKGTQVLTRPKPGALKEGAPAPDLYDVKGQETAKRALEIAAAGGHNLLMVGPPGSGKSMMASRLPGLLPPLTAREMLEVSMIQSVAGMIEDGALTRTRPFRSPHHSASMPAMVGGGSKARPGEASLAHHGVLFLDELPEFQATVLDSLRQPLETGDVRIARANAHVRYPACFQLVAAMNPCRCGYGRASGRACGRGAHCEEQYQSRVSGPFLDRLDLSIETPPVTALDLAAPPSGERSAVVAERVAAARAIQADRAGSTGTDALNARASEQNLAAIAQPDAEGAALLTRACESLSLSARAYTRILKVARTLADLDGGDGVRRRHIAEAISFRQREPADSSANFAQPTAMKSATQRK